MRITHDPKISKPTILFQSQHLNFEAPHHGLKNSSAWLKIPGITSNKSKFSWLTWKANVSVREVSHASPFFHFRSFDNLSLLTPARAKARDGAWNITRENIFRVSAPRINFPSISCLMKYQITLRAERSDKWCCAHLPTIHSHPRTTLTTIDWSSQGHDTTSVGICWALFLIGLHDEAQEGIFHEMTEIFGEDTERVATYHDLNEMKYLERVLKESLRLYPSVPNISRKMSEDIEIGEAFAGLRSLCEALPAGNIEKENFHELYDPHSHKFPRNPEFDTLCYISFFFIFSLL